MLHHPPDENRSVWVAESAAPEPAPALKGRLATDVAIIGGGFTGVSTAWHLRQQNPGLGIALLEAGVLGQGASGRNGGQVLNWINGHDPKTPESMRRVHRATSAGIDLAETLAQRFAPPGTFRRRGCLSIYTEERQPRPPRRTSRSCAPPASRPSSCRRAGSTSRARTAPYSTRWRVA